MKKCYPSKSLGPSFSPAALPDGRPARSPGPDARGRRSPTWRFTRDAAVGGGEFPKENRWKFTKKHGKFRHQNGKFTEKWEETTSS